MRFAPLFALLSLVACDVQINAGEVTREDRTVDAFSRVDTSGMFDVEIDVGGPEAVSIVCGERLIEDIITEVDSNDSSTSPCARGPSGPALVSVRSTFVCRS